MFALPAECLGIPRFRLVQLGLLPSKAEIARGLLEGQYMEYL